jgi:hypothetical protein
MRSRTTREAFDGIVKLAELIALQRKHHGPGRLRGNLGDGLLFARNPFYRRVRLATLARGFRYTADDPGDYFAFPLAALDVLYATRRVPYRDNVGAVARLERLRPGFFELKDLAKNRPLPNYVLHESAHAVSFHELFGRPKNVPKALALPGSLLGIELGEAYAMTAEYFAACATRPGVERWVFSINSYRQRVPAKAAIGELVGELGLEPVAFCVLLAFLANLFFEERVALASVERMFELHAAGEPRKAPPKLAVRQKLRRALSALMRMNPEFRRDTTRLFLTTFGRARSVEKVLGDDPLELLGRDEASLLAAKRLVRVLARDAR